MSNQILLLIVVLGCLYLIFDTFAVGGKGYIKNFVNGVFS